MVETNTLAEKAGGAFGFGARFAFEDAMQRRLRYHLLRLTTVGLTREDVDQLGELGKLAFSDAGVTSQVTAIRERPDASPLASAIASIVEASGPGEGGRAGRAEVMVGALVGAYAGLLDTGNRDPLQTAIGGATGGAIAASVGRFIQERIADAGETEYLRMNESL